MREICACMCVFMCMRVCYGYYKFNRRLNGVNLKVSIRVGRYHIFTSGIRYYKLRTVFGIPRFLIKQVDEPLSSVNG